MLQSNNISELLTSLLTLHKSIFIPGLGSFRIESTHPLLGENDHTYGGPYMVVRFYEQKGDEDVDFIDGGIQAGFIPSDERTDWAEFVEDKVNELLNFDKTTLKDFCTIEINSTGERIMTESFSPLFIPMRLMPSIELRPLTSEFEKEQSLLEIAHIEKPAEMVHMVTNEPIKVSNSVSAAIPANVSTPPVEPSSFRRDPYEDESTPWSKFILGTVALVLCLLALFFILKTCTEKKNTSTSESTEATALLDSTATSETSIPQDLIQKYAPHITPNVVQNGCEIVIGSFASHQNAISRQLVAQRKGYDVVVSPRASGYRVIIVFDCVTIDMLEYLEQVKEDLAVDAWFLVPMSFKPDEWHQ